MPVSPLTSTVALQEQLARAGNKVVVVDFTAKWCGPCKKIAPQLEKLSETYAASMNVFSVDVDEVRELVEHFKVSSMPTFIFFYRNQVMYVTKGADADKLTMLFDMASSFSKITSQ